MCAPYQELASDVVCLDFADKGGISGITPVGFFSSVKSMDGITNPIDSPDLKCAMAFGPKTKFIAGGAGSMRFALFIAFEDF